MIVSIASMESYDTVFVGTFALSAAEAEEGVFGGAGQAGGDPCEHAGATMTEDVVVISF